MKIEEFINFLFLFYRWSEDKLCTKVSETTTSTIS